MSKITHKPGKRKTAVARTTIREGKGEIRINKIPLKLIKPKAKRMRIEECLMIASPYVDLDKIDIKINVRGGGVMGQADAIASSISRALVEFSGSDDLLHEYLNYDRTLIAGDHRLTEVHKPSQSSKGPRHKRQKSYR